MRAGGTRTNPVDRDGAIGGYPTPSGIACPQVEPDELAANGLGSLERSSQVVKRPGSSNQKRSAIVSTGWMTCAGATGPSSDASTGTTPGLVV
jgi:hypothetical protein